MAGPAEFHYLAKHVHGILESLLSCDRLAAAAAAADCSSLAAALGDTCSHTGLAAHECQGILPASLHFESLLPGEQPSKDRGQLVEVQPSHSIYVYTCYAPRKPSSTNSAAAPRHRVIALHAKQ